MSSLPARRGVFDQLQSAEPGTFYLTDFLACGHFRPSGDPRPRAWTGIRSSQSSNFRNYRRLVYPRAESGLPNSVEAGARADRAGNGPSSFESRRQQEYGELGSPPWGALLASPPRHLNGHN